MGKIRIIGIWLALFEGMSSRIEWVNANFPISHYNYRQEVRTPIIMNFFFFVLHCSLSIFDARILRSFLGSPIHYRLPFMNECCCLDTILRCREFIKFTASLHHSELFSFVELMVSLKKTFEFFSYCGQKCSPSQLQFAKPKRNPSTVWNSFSW